MASANITIRSVQSLQPGHTIWDAGHREAVRGFGVRRQRGQPVYVLKYRSLGRQRFVTIGPHGSPWAPDTARKEAKRLLGQVAGGRDPQAEKITARIEAADTFHKVAEQYLIQAKRRLRPRTYAENHRYLIKVCKSLHTKPIVKILRRDIAACLAEIDKRRGAVSARQARARLSAMFAWAIREGLDIPANPVFGTNQPGTSKSRERVLSETELAAIWRACTDDDYGRIVRLLILTAQRRDEVGGLSWPEIEPDAIRLPPARTKNHREHLLPLSPAALALLPARRNDRDFLFGNGPRREGDPHRGFSGWSKSKAALDARITEALGKALPPWTIHDVRRSAATMMADRLGVLPHILEAILNHVSGHRAGVAGVYNLAVYLGPMRSALEHWADHVASLAKPPRPKSIHLVRKPITGP